MEEISRCTRRCRRRCGCKRGCGWTARPQVAVGASVFSASGRGPRAAQVVSSGRQRERCGAERLAWSREHSQLTRSAVQMAWPETRLLQKTSLGGRRAVSRACVWWVGCGFVFGEESGQRRAVTMRRCVKLRGGHFGWSWSSLC